MCYCCNPRRGGGSARNLDRRLSAKISPSADRLSSRRATPRQIFPKKAIFPRENTWEIHAKLIHKIPPCLFVLPACNQLPEYSRDTRIRIFVRGAPYSFRKNKREKLRIPLWQRVSEYCGLSRLQSVSFEYIARASAKTIVSFRDNPQLPVHNSRADVFRALCLCFIHSGHCAVVINYKSGFAAAINSAIRLVEFQCSC